MERAFVEMPDLAGGDALSLGTEVYGFARSPQRSRGPFEDLGALFRKRLRNRPENPDQVSDKSEGKDLAQEPGEEEPRVGQAQGDQDEHVDRRGVVRDVDGLGLGKRPVLVDDETDIPERERPLAERRDDGLAVEARKAERGKQGDDREHERTGAHQSERQRRPEEKGELFHGLHAALQTTVCIARFRRRSKSSSGESRAWPRKYGTIARSRFRPRPRRILNATPANR